MKAKIKAQLIVIGIIITVMGSVFAGLGLYSQSRQAELDAHGVTAPAEITAAAIESGAKSNKRCIFTVQWGEPQSRQTKKFEVEKAYYLTRVDAEGKLTSPATTVRHLPGKPDSALLDGAAYPFAGWQKVGYGVILFGVFLLLLGLRVKVPPGGALGLPSE